MKKFKKDIVKILEDNGFVVGEITKQSNEIYVDLNQSTPLGEDWWVVIFFDGTNNDFIQEFYRYAYNFDIDDEVEPYVQNRAKNGIPNSIVDLIEDAQWKQKTLEETADKLYNLL